MRERWIFIVEDEESKYNSVLQVIRDAIGIAGFIYDRARTVVEAESILHSAEQPPALLILDISMNISPGSLGPMRGGFANLGGLEIAEGLYLHRVSVPTIILTGFDFFQSAVTDRSEFDLLSLAEITERAREMFGAQLLGCIRYGNPDWSGELSRLVRGVIG